MALSESGQVPNGYMEVFLVLLTGTLIWPAFQFYSSVAGTERLARTGEVANQFRYTLDSVKCGIGFSAVVAMSMCLCGGADRWCRRPPQLRLIQAAALGASAVYAAWQVLWRTRNLVMASVARKCLAQDVSYVGVLGSDFACQGAQAYAYAPGYVKGLPYVIAAWTYSLVALVGLLMVTINEKEPAKTVEEDRGVLDEKLDSKLCTA